MRRSLILLPLLLGNLSGGSISGGSMGPAAVASVLSCAADTNCACEEPMMHTGILAFTAAHAFDFGDTTSKECGEDGNGQLDASASAEVKITSDVPSGLGAGVTRVAMFCFNGAAEWKVRFLDTAFLTISGNEDDTVAMRTYWRMSTAADPDSQSEDWADMGAIESPGGDNSERRKLMQITNAGPQAQIQMVSGGGTFQGIDTALYPELYAGNNDVGMDEFKTDWIEIQLACDGLGGGTHNCRSRVKRVSTQVAFEYTSDPANPQNFGTQLDTYPVQFNRQNDNGGDGCMYITHARVDRVIGGDNTYWVPPNCTVEPSATGC